MKKLLVVIFILVTVFIFAATSIAAFKPATKRKNDANDPPQAQTIDKSSVNQPKTKVDKPKAEQPKNTKSSTKESWDWGNKK